MFYQSHSIFKILAKCNLPLPYLVKDSEYYLNLFVMTKIVMIKT